MSIVTGVFAVDAAADDSLGGKGSSARTSSLLRAEPVVVLELHVHEF
jgi:hypothetical protein